MFMVGDILWFERLVEKMPPKFSGCSRLPSGTLRWHKDGVIHRSPDLVTGEELPAIVWHDGDIAFYVDGMPHRVNGPAFIFNNVDCEWWFTGEFFGYGLERPENFPKP